MIVQEAYISAPLSKPEHAPPKQSKVPKRNVNTIFNYGYNVGDPTHARHVALTRSADAQGYAVTLASLGYLEATSRNSCHHDSKTYAKDKQWVYDTFRFK